MAIVADILKMVVDGKLSKAAAVRVLEPLKGQVLDRAEKTKQGDTMSDIALKALTQVGAMKATDLAGQGIGALWSRATQGRRDALFQQLMSQHPSLQGKDPARAKANFDYLLSQAPHLQEHPLILGDQVGNMTAMGTTDISTLKTLADMEKSRTDAASAAARPSMSAQLVGDAIGKGLDRTVDQRMKKDEAATQHGNRVKELVYQQTLKDQSAPKGNSP